MPYSPYLFSNFRDVSSYFEVTCPGSSLLSLYMYVAKFWSSPLSLHSQQQPHRDLSRWCTICNVLPEMALFMMANQFKRVNLPPNTVPERDHVCLRRCDLSYLELHHLSALRNIPQSHLYKDAQRQGKGNQNSSELIRIFTNCNEKSEVFYLEQNGRNDGS